MNKEAMRMALEALGEILESFEKDGKFCKSSLIRNELFDRIKETFDKCKAVVEAEQEQGEPVGKMTASRAEMFMTRFKHEEKMLGPNEQAALDYVIAMLVAKQEHGEPVAFLANGTRFKISYDSRQSGGQIHGIPPELGGRWVAFVAAEDDCHLKLTTTQQEPFTRQILDEWTKEYKKEADYWKARHDLLIKSLKRNSVEPVEFITPLMESQMFDDWCPYKGNPDPRTVWAAAIEAVNGLLLGAKQEQGEPVAWQERQAKRMKDGVVIEWTNWYPCRYRTIDEAQAEACDHIPYEWRPLYTTPQQRKPLTDEQIMALLVELCVPTKYEGVTETFTAVVRAIEAAHGIKE